MPLTPAPSSNLSSLQASPDITQTEEPRQAPVRVRHAHNGAGIAFPRHTGTSAANAAPDVTPILNWKYGGLVQFCIVQAESDKIKGKTTSVVELSRKINLLPGTLFAMSVGGGGYEARCGSNSDGPPLIDLCVNFNSNYVPTKVSWLDQNKSEWCARVIKQPFGYTIKQITDSASPNSARVQRHHPYQDRGRFKAPAGQNESVRGTPYPAAQSSQTSDYQGQNTLEIYVSNPEGETYSVHEHTNEKTSSKEQGAVQQQVSPLNADSSLFGEPLILSNDLPSVLIQTPTAGGSVDHEDNRWRGKPFRDYERGAANPPGSAGHVGPASSASSDSKFANLSPLTFSNLEDGNLPE